MPAVVVQRRHVRMVDLRGGHRLAVETLGQLGRQIVAHGEQLQRDITMESAVARGPHLSHPAPPQTLQQLIASRYQVPNVHRPPTVQVLQ
ncbi:hypothetical protein GCM10010315_10000 [Streptomyces luteosporeus]|uniref:Uncharacterized protein n=1 Tax=Streptomyces luteosporeus TaxID=173856 RepID=A0ABN3TLU9_9ACTN